MLKETIKSNDRIIPLSTNESSSKKVLIFFHGLDGSAAFSKPLFKALASFKVVAIEQRGHMNSPLPASRLISKHLDDYLTVIKHYKKLGYQIWISGESMGGAYVALLSYLPIISSLVEGAFIWSIPNRLINIMSSSKMTQLKIQLLTVVSFLTNTNYKFKMDISYKSLSNNAVLQRIARIDNNDKVRQTRETLATWAANKRAWRVMKRKNPLIPLTYFHADSDLLCMESRVKATFAKKRQNINYVEVPDSKHILLYEKNGYIIFEYMKSKMV